MNIKIAKYYAEKIFESLYQQNFPSKNPIISIFIALNNFQTLIKKIDKNKYILQLGIFNNINIKHIKALILHEFYHIIYKSFETGNYILSKYYPHPEILVKKAINILEDYYINKKIDYIVETHIFINSLIAKNHNQNYEPGNDISDITIYFGLTEEQKNRLLNLLNTSKEKLEEILNKYEQGKDSDDYLLCYEATMELCKLLENSNNITISNDSIQVQNGTIDGKSKIKESEIGDIATGLKPSDNNYVGNIYEPNIEIVLKEYKKIKNTIKKLKQSNTIEIKTETYIGKRINRKWLLLPQLRNIIKPMINTKEIKTTKENKIAIIIDCSLSMSIDFAIEKAIAIAYALKEEFTKNIAIITCNLENLNIIEYNESISLLNLIQLCKLIGSEHFEKIKKSSKATKIIKESKHILLFTDFEISSDSIEVIKKINKLILLYCGTPDNFNENNAKKINKKYIVESDTLQLTNKLIKLLSN